MEIGDSQIRLIQVDLKSILTRKLDGAFDFLTDEHNRATRALGITAPQVIPMGI